MLFHHLWSQEVKSLALAGKLVVEEADIFLDAIADEFGPAEIPNFDVSIFVN